MSLNQKGGPGTSRRLTPPLKCHVDGGKQDLAKWIISLMPERCKTPNNPSPTDLGWLAYVEPYFGGGAILLAQNPEGISEVANDLNGDLMNFWMQLQSADTFHDFKRIVDTIPFSEGEWKFSSRASVFGTDTDRAVNFFVKCRQSLAGRMTGFASISRRRTRGGMNEQVSAWLNAIEGLPAVHARLKRVLILNRPALDVIREQDGPRTLYYCDPPYLHETRVTTSEYGEFEMTEKEHDYLLQTLGNIEGKFILSGYRSELYDTAAEAFGWNRHEKKIHNHASGAKTKPVMTECCWTNF